MPGSCRSSRRSTVALVAILAALAAALAADAKPANRTAEDSSEEHAYSEEDMDFPEDPGPESRLVAVPGGPGGAPGVAGASVTPSHPAYSHSPVSVYVLRLLEILIGAETMGKPHTRFARDSGDSLGYGYPEAPEGGRASTAASYTSYYDFLISEGSYKFWAAFQIGTAILLTYSAIAALYYARYTYYTNVDYSDYDDYFFKRSSGRSGRSVRTKAGAAMSATEFQRVMDAASGSKYARKSS